MCVCVCLREKACGFHMAELISRMYICYHRFLNPARYGKSRRSFKPTHLSTLSTFCIWKPHVGLSYLILSFISSSPLHFSPLLLGLLKLTQGHFNLAFWPQASESYTAKVNGASASSSIYVCVCVCACLCSCVCACGRNLLGYIGLGGWRPNRSQKSNAFCLSCE